MSTGPRSTLAGRVLSHGSDSLVVAPPPSLVRSFVSRLASTPDQPPESGGRVRLLCTEQVIETAMTDFLTATAAADAAGDGRLAIRTASPLDSSFTLADGVVYAHVSLSEHSSNDGADRAPVTGVSEHDADLYTTLSDRYDQVWATADPYDPDPPPRSVLVESFRQRWPDAAETLAGAFESAETLPSDGAVDPVVVCTLVAARHRILTMRLGEWVEAIGFSSRTEISRAKRRLVDADLVDTEPEANGVGRPRHRLVPAPAVEGVGGAELLATARAALAE